MKRRRDADIVIDASTAADIMDAHFLVVGSQGKLKSLADKFHRYLKKHQVTPSVFVWTKKEGLLGEIPLVKILHASDADPISSLVKPVHTLHKHVSRHDILLYVAKTHINRLIVIDDEEKPEGIIHTHDLLHLIQQQEHGMSLRMFAGVQYDERAIDGPMTAVSLRYRWLIINLATAILAALSVSLFENTLTQMVILAAYMPIVAGMGGNAATQTIAVMVRGLALGEVHRSNALRVIRKEVIAGFLNGCITGLVMAGVAFFLGQSLMLGFVIATALVINLVIAGFFGSIIPLVLKRLHFDPALSASIFVTTATDIFGFISFLGLATLFLL